MLVHVAQNLAGDDGVDLAPDRLVSITSYDGLPVASRFLVQALESALAERGVSVPPAAPGQGETP